MGIDGENKKERRALFLRLLEESEINGRYSAPRVARWKLPVCLRMSPVVET